MPVSDTELPTIAVWLEPAQAPFVANVAAHARVRIGVAGAAGPGFAADVAKSLEAHSVDDLRELLLGLRSASPASEPTENGRNETFAVDALWLASMEGIDASENTALLAALRGCLARGVPVFTSAPLPGSILEFAESIDRPVVAGVPDSDAIDNLLAQAAAPSNWPVFFPRFRLSPSFIDMQEYLEPFGPIGAAHLLSLGNAVELVAGARLIDALDTIAFLLGEPEELYAAYTPRPGHASRQGPATLIGGANANSISTLRHLQGTLSASMRFSDGRTASVLVSDSAGATTRSLTLIGQGTGEQGGRIVVSAGAIEWFDSQGRPLEQRMPSRRRTDPPRTPEGVQAFAETLASIGRGHARMQPPMNHVSVLAMAGAAMLSAATGEPESPQTIRRMVLSA